MSSNPVSPIRTIPEKLAEQPQTHISPHKARDAVVTAMHGMWGLFLDDLGSAAPPGGSR